ncbi:MAG: gliding motility-associated C-terminal domain-containing protein [Bacteroidia bacterium]|nr:gliding motility-associated C-terminal domain-containing protein [Bacteroidia bacterium]
MKAIFTPFLYIILTASTCFGQVTYLKTIDLHALNFGQALTPTKDKGYIVVGQEEHLEHRDGEDIHCNFYWAKFDSCATILYSNIFAWLGSPRMKAFGPRYVIQSTVPNKIVTTGMYTINLGNATAPNLLTEMFVLQIDEAGTIDWMTSISDGTNVSQGAHLCESTSGYIACGFVNEDALSVKTPYITKLDKTNGALIWEKKLSSLNGTYSNANYVEEFPNGDILLLGSYGNGVNNNFYALRLDGAGNIIWSKEYDVSQFDGLDWDVSGKITSDGAFLISGSTKQGTNYNTALIKANATTGAVIHTATFDNAGQEDRGRTVTELTTGDYVQMGNTEAGGIAHTIMNKVSKNFNYKWSRTMTLNNYSKSWGINENSDKGIVFSGLTLNTTSKYVALLVKTDSLGNLGSACNKTATPTITYNTPFVSANTVIVTTSSSPSCYFNNIDKSSFSFNLHVQTPVIEDVCFDCNPVLIASKTNICPNDTFYTIANKMSCGQHTLSVAEVATGIVTVPFKVVGDTNFYILTTPGSFTITRNTVCNGVPNVIVKNIEVFTFPVVTITSTPSFCQADKDTLFATVTSGTAPYTYTWSGVGVPNINNSTLPLNTNATLNVMLSIKDSYGCKSASAVYTLQNYPLPQPNFTVVDVCLNQTSLFVNTTPASPTITSNNWLFYNGASTLLGTNNVSNGAHLFTTCNEAFTAKLITTTDRGCVDSITKPVIVHCLPIPNFTFNNGCEKDTSIHFINASVNGNGTVGAVNSIWFLDVNNPTESTSNPIKTYYTAGEYPVTLKITDIYGCTKDNTQNLKVYPKPNANFTTASVCLHTQSVFNNTATLNVPTTGGFTDVINGYKWDYNYDNVTFTTDATTSNASYTYPIAATENKPLVTYIIKTNNNCKDTITKPITVWTLPLVSYTTNAPCYPNPLEFKNATTIHAGTDNSAVANMVEKWGDNKLEIIPQLTTQTTHNYSTSGNYQTMLIATSNKGCVDSLKVPVVIHAKPKALFTLAPPEGCEPLCVMFTNYSTQNQSPVVETISKYEWTLGDYNNATSADNIPTTKDPNYCYENSSDTVQKHSVNLIVTTNAGCKDTLLKQNAVTVFPMPTAAFTVSPTVTDMLNSQIYITDQSHLANVIEWNYGDGHTKLLRNTTPLLATLPYYYTYTDSGIYTINQLVSTNYGCIDTATRIIKVKPIYTIYIPNTFTPNNDGINDDFKPVGINIKEIDLFIYDRWGVLIARIQGGINAKGWDGNDYRTGEPCKTEVYNWKLNYIDIFNEKHTDWIGSVTLIK